MRSGEAEPNPIDYRRAVRDVIRRCIYAVDKNPLAVDLCKVALWIEGHSEGLPLSFLDHHVKCGDSLIGVFDLKVLEVGVPHDAFKVGTDDDDEIIRRLDALVPSAALSYKQAIFDLKDDGRVSFRGPALELREPLREILDNLAPDSEVTAAPEYVQEKDRTGPTMKQKVRFIMKKKGKRSSSDAPELAVATFEEAIAGLTRAVYERSSKATHVAGERQTVVQLRRYVVAILHEIIET